MQISWSILKVLTINQTAQTVIVAKGFLKLPNLHMLIKQKSPLLPRKLALVTSCELLIVFSTKVNLLYRLYSTVRRCCLLHLIKQIIQYRFLNGTQMIEPSESTRMYPRVRLRFKSQLESKERPKKADFQVEKEKGGLEECKISSHFTRSKQAYNENYKLTQIQKLDDPLKSLNTKQRADGLIGKEIMRKIIFNNESFIVVLFTDRMINNVASFCWNNTDQFLSSFFMDFTFKIGDCFYLFSFSKTAPYYRRKELVALFKLVQLCVIKGWKSAQSLLRRKTWITSIASKKVNKKMSGEGRGLCPYQITKKTNSSQLHIYTNFIKHFTPPTRINLHAHPPRIYYFSKTLCI